MASSNHRQFGIHRYDVGEGEVRRFAETPEDQDGDLFTTPPVRVTTPPAPSTRRTWDPIRRSPSSK